VRDGLVIGIREKYIAFAGYRASAMARGCVFPPGTQSCKLSHVWGAWRSLPKELFDLMPPREDLRNPWKRKDVKNTLASASLTPCTGTQRTQR
jgi:hypothetical protein